MTARGARCLSGRRGYFAWDGGAVAATASAASIVQSTLADSTARKNCRGSSVTYVVSRATPRASTATSSGRPLTSLWSVTRKVPPPAGVSWLVAHRRRSDPVSLMNGSVCVEPWPDHEPSVRQTTVGVRARAASFRHEVTSNPAPRRAISNLQSAIRNVRGLRNLVQSLGQLDVGAPRIGEEGDRDPQRRHFSVGHAHLDAVGFQLFREFFEVLHFEADVIERAAGGSDDRIGRRREVERDAW